MNFVVVLWDEIGKDQYGGLHPEFGGAGTTALLEARAENGVTFSKNTASGQCSPCRASLLTGLHHKGHGVGVAIDVSASIAQGLDPDIASLPRVLTANGYQTAGIGKWHLSGANDPTQIDHPLNIGFQTWEGTWRQAGQSFMTSGVTGYNGFEWIDANTASAQLVTSTFLTTYTADRAIAKHAELVANGDPFFLYVCFNACHEPLICPPSALHDYGETCTSGDGPNRTFRANKQALDRETDRFLDEIDLNTTNVMVMGDNGTPDTVIQGYPSTQAKGTMYLGGMRTPLIAFGAGVSAVGFSDALVQAVDIPATILELAGLVGTFPEAIDSISFAPLLSNLSASRRRQLAYCDAFFPNGLPVVPDQESRSGENDRYHLVRLVDNSEKFFDVEIDPFELSPLDLDHLSRHEQQSYDDLRWVIETNGHVTRRQTKARRTLRIQR